MFFDVHTFVAFVKACRAIGIKCPIVPGIMCIMKYGGFVRMTGMCKSRVPSNVWESLDAIKDDATAVKNFGIEFGTKLCRDLLATGLVSVAIDVPPNVFVATSNSRLHGRSARTFLGARIALLHPQSHVMRVRHLERCVFQWNSFTRLTLPNLTQVLFDM